MDDEDEEIRRKTVLIIDDSVALVNRLKTMFAAADWSVGTALDGEEAFRKIAAYNPDVIFLDVYMPKITGTEVCRLVKAHPRWKRACIVIISGSLTQNDEEVYRTLGAEHILRKPFAESDALALAERAYALQQGDLDDGP